MNESEVIARLRPHQPGPVKHLLGLFGSGVQSAVDLSWTGTGKTYVAAATLSLLKTPTLVVAPKIARTAWERAAAHFEDRFSVVGYELLRAGQTPFGKWDNNQRVADEFFKCVNCQLKVDLDKFQPCYAHPQGIHCIETKKKPIRRGKFNFHPAVKTVVFDEGHRCGAIDSLNADMMIAAKQQGKRILTLSATPACSPLGMRALGYLLGLHNLNADLLEVAKIGQRLRLPSFRRWAYSQGCVMDARFHGWKWMAGRERQLEVMRAIREQLIPAKGVCVTTDDIPGFPACDISAELYDLDDPAAIDGCYQEMAEAVAMIHSRAAFDKNLEHPLTKMLRGRQTVEVLKVPLATELAEDYLAAGNSVVFFVNFTQTIDELKKRFPEAGVIDGTTPGRDETVERFQVNELRALIVNNEAGKESMSLHDLQGGHPRVGLVFPCFSATTMQQVFGRLPRDGGKTPCFYRVLFANKTLEVPIQRALEAKRGNMRALVDEDLTPDGKKW